MAESLLRIITGAYERNLNGFDLMQSFNAEYDEKKTSSYSLKTVFSYAPHHGCIKAVAASSGGLWLASGSTDERIQLYNLKERVEYGDLLQHQGTITTLVFHDNDHMLSGSEDGTIAVWRTSDWECLKVLKGHKGAVNCVAIHPSGKLLLSVGRDKKVITWDLIKGRLAFQTNLKQEASTIVWSPCGSFYSIVHSRIVCNFAVSTGNKISEYVSSSRVNAIAYLSESMLAVGGDAEEVVIIDINAQENANVIVTLHGHTSRIRGIAALPHPLHVHESDRFLVITGSADANIKVWDVSLKTGCKSVLHSKDEVDCVAQLQSRDRLTCLCISTNDDIIAKPSKKREPVISKAQKKEAVLVAALEAGAANIKGKEGKKKKKGVLQASEKAGKRVATAASDSNKVGKTKQRLRLQTSIYHIIFEVNPCE